KRKTPTVQELAERKQILMYQVLPVYFNDKKITLTKQLAQIRRKGQILQMQDLLYSGDDIRIEQKPFEGFLFQDLFAFVNINMPENGGGSFQLLRNGERATFLTPIKKGDKLSIIWPVKTGSSPSMNK
ncbi:MAG: cell division protein, partial [Niallia sp.]